MSATSAFRKAKTVVLSVAIGAMPLVTTGSCDPFSGSLSFYRNDDARHSNSFWDILIEDDYCYDDYYDGYYYEEVVYYDDCGFWDCYYDDYYYEEVIFFP